MQQNEKGNAVVVDTDLLQQPVRRRALRSSLKRLRKAAGLSVGQAGALIGRSGPTISRMESGETETIRVPDVRTLCEGYGASPDETARLITLAAENKGARSWWQEFGGAEPWFENLLALEGEASSLSWWQPALVPGLLQTEAYAREVTIGDAQDIDRRVRLRLARQTILDRTDPPDLSVVLDEAVLNRAIGGAAVMRGQLEHLAESMDRPNVTVHLLPLSAGTHAALVGGPFLVMRFPDPSDPGVAYLEGHAGATYVEEPKEIERFAGILDELRACSLPPEATRARIAAVAAAL